MRRAATVFTPPCRPSPPGGKCPDLVFVRPRFDVYRAVSQQIRGIFARYTRLIQPLSLDEAYLDVTAPLVERGSATAIAEVNTSRDQSRDGSDGIGGRLLQQVPGKARIRPSQTRRAVRHHAKNGARIR